MTVRLPGFLIAFNVPKVVHQTNVAKEWHQTHLLLACEQEKTSLAPTHIT
jgi:hypothetical protein